MAFQICITFFTPPTITLYVLAAIKQFFVKRVLAKRLCRTEYDEFVAGTGYGHIHASEVRQETYLTRLVGTHQTHHHYIALLPLKGIDCVHSNPVSYTHLTLPTKRIV